MFGRGGVEGGGEGREGPERFRGRLFGVGRGGGGGAGFVDVLISVVGYRVRRRERRGERRRRWRSDSSRSWNEDG